MGHTREREECAFSTLEEHRSKESKSLKEREQIKLMFTLFLTLNVVYFQPRHAKWSTNGLFIVSDI